MWVGIIQSIASLIEQKGEAKGKFAFFCLSWDIHLLLSSALGPLDSEWDSGHYHLSTLGPTPFLCL